MANILFENIGFKIMAKIKIAADLYPFRFIAVKAQAKKHGGGFSVEEF